MINRAYVAGRERFDWWPAWKGQCAAIVASGPSIKQTDLSVLRDRIHVIVIKATVDLMPWADIVYGCDSAWWLDRKGLPKFKGLKFFHGVAAANRWPDMHRVEIDLRADAMLVDTPLTIGNGGNSGFQAINLAIQFGATSILLVGFDAGEFGGKLHWYGRNTAPGMNNPLPSNFKRWKTGFELAKKGIDQLGVEVVNCSVQTTINTFRKASLPEILEEWGL